jgi:hypothetical protein
MASILQLLLEDVLHVPWLAVNLLSITKCITKQGVQFTANNRNLFLSIHVTQIKFDKEIQHGTGKLYAIDIKPLSNEAAYLILDFNKFHNMLVHPHNVTLKETAKANNIQLAGVHHRPCTHCAEAKIRMKMIPKEPSENTATVKGKRLMIDISWIKTESVAKNRYWLLIMDEYTNFSWSYFMKNKDDQVSIVIKHIKMLQNEPKIKVKYIGCDKSGENHDIQNYLRERYPKIRCKFEFTAPDSPQQNGKIERKFATLYGRVRAILNCAQITPAFATLYGRVRAILNVAQFTPALRNVMWAFCSLHATRLDNILIRPDTHLSPYEMYHRETPKWVPFLKAFGEIAIVKTPTKLQAKLTNRGVPAFYLGPAEDHKGYTYTFWNPITKHVFESRSAIFLQQTYAEFHKLDKSQIAKQFATIKDSLNKMFDEDEDVTPEDDEGNHLPNQMNNEDEDEDSKFVTITEDMLDPANTDITYKEEEEDTEDDASPASVQQKFARIPREIRSLATFYNPNPQDE